jgi:hypothetical protein
LKTTKKGWVLVQPIPFLLPPYLPNVHRRPFWIFI